MLHKSEKSPSFSPEVQLLSTDYEIIAARNAIDTHAQDFVANDGLLLPTLKAFTLYIR